jgi:hypothetical protein
MDKSYKMEGDYHVQRWATWFLWKEGVKPSDIHRRLPAVFGQKSHARNAVLNGVRGFKSDKEIVQVSVHEWHRNSAEEWFSEDNRKL